jgi:hypothetical protein
MLSYECKDCGAILRSEEEFKAHAKICKDQIWVDCSECGESFPNRARLRTHMLTKHNLDGWPHS